MNKPDDGQVHKQCEKYNTDQNLCDISYFIIIYTPLLPVTKFNIWFGTSKYQENQFESIPPYLMALMMALNNIKNIEIDMLPQCIIILGSCE